MKKMLILYTTILYKFRRKKNMPYIAYVLISTTIGEEENVRRELLKVEGVKEADTTSGAYDNVAVLEGDSVDELIDVVTDTIRKIPSVVKTETLVAKKIE
jgi:DNA-binding Lrp family transcriptional regulator